MVYRKPPLEEQFWAKVDVRHPTECWPWRGSTSTNGYGLLNERRATHISLELAGVARPDGYAALHSCDNPICVNPSHLRWGNEADNAADMVARRRHQANRKTECIHGHPLSGDNLILRANGQRACLQCRRDAQQRYHLAHGRERDNELRRVRRLQQGSEKP